jgi:hypothetical protein
MAEHHELEVDASNLSFGKREYPGAACPSLVEGLMTPGSTDVAPSEDAWANVVVLSNAEVAVLLDRQRKDYEERNRKIPE